MIDLYYWPTPNGWKITIALEEMGLPYKVIPVDIAKGDQFKPAFLAIAPNNRMPAIVDPDGPDGAPIAIFESGAILQYLARKTGTFCGPTQRDRIAVDQWLMWQMGGVGPMAGQAHHFLHYAPEMDPPNLLPYAQDRYRREVGRLYGVLDRQLAQTEFVAGNFLSIADMAIWPWAQGWQRQEQTLDDKPHFARWLATLAARPAFVKGKAVGADWNRPAKMDKAAQEMLFGKR
jgi:GSH-dependent disulfide-bond oxidoreductase